MTLRERFAGYPKGRTFRAIHSTFKDFSKMEEV